MGICYYNGNGVEKNLEEAVKWIRKAAEQEDAEAQYNLGFCYYYGHGVHKNLDKAIEWFRKAEKQGHSGAKTNLIIPEIKLYIQATEKNDPDAQFELGELYADGKGVKQDHKEALKWYKKAAEQGHKEAHYAYLKLNLYIQATEKNDSNAQFELGNLYADGKGVKQDHKEALKWYEKAAEQGHKEAQYELGICYLNGTGVERNENEALNWLKKAAEKSHDKAKIKILVITAKQQGLQLSEDGETLQSFTDKEILSCTIPDRVTVINDDAFKDCSKLEYITLTEQLYRKYFYFFKNMKCTVKISPKTTQIAADAFSGHKIVAVILPEGLIEIGKNAFADCNNMQNVVLPSTVKKIGLGAFSGCTDQNSAYAWFCSNADDPVSMYNAALCLLEGNGTTQNSSEALKFLAKAAENNHIDSALLLTKIYKHGYKDIILPNETLFRKYITIAMQLGDAEAQYYLAKNILQENQVEEIIDLLEKSARQGHEKALFELGCRYYEGKGIKQDYAEAFQCFKKSAEKGYVPAINNLGLCFELGHGTAVDAQKASEKYLVAAQKDYIPAMYNYALCLELGTGVDIDLTKAFIWYKKAAEKNYKEAQYNLAFCFKEGKGTKQNYKEAAKWFFNAAVQGYDEAQYEYGLCCENGFGISADAVKAVEWYTKAAEQGNDWGQFALGKALAEGKGATQNIEKAREWLEKAAAQGNKSAEKYLKKLSNNNKK